MFLKNQPGAGRQWKTNHSLLEGKKERRAGRVKKAIHCFTTAKDQRGFIHQKNKMEDRHLIASIGLGTTLINWSPKEALPFRIPQRNFPAWETQTLRCLKRFPSFSPNSSLLATITQQPNCIFCPQTSLSEPHHAGLSGHKVCREHSRAASACGGEGHFGLLVARRPTNSPFLTWMDFRIAVSQAEKAWITAIKMQTLPVMNNSSSSHPDMLH